MADVNSNSESSRRIQKDANAGPNSPAGLVDDSRLPVLVQQLREKLEDNEKCSGHVRLADDDFLSMFLRVKGYDLDRALEAAEKYYRHFEKFPEILAGIQTSSKYKPVYDDKIFVVLREKCRRKCTVCLLRICAWDVTKHNQTIVRQSNLFMLQEMVQMPDVQLTGCSIIVDLKNFSFGHLRQVKPHDMKFFIQTCQDGIPLRIASVHIINYPPIFLGLYYIAYGFMKEKLRSRIHWHKSVASLHEHVDPAALPKCLGGTQDMEAVEDGSIERNLIERDRHYADYYL